MSRFSILRRLRRRWRAGGPAAVLAAVRDQWWPAHPACWREARAGLLGRRGLEIGGPSPLFGPRGALPAYAWAAGIDNVTFAPETAWDRGRRDGGTFRFHRRKPPGRQWIREATDLAGIADGAYEFVLASHCLEHVANPLAALREWRRVVRPGARLVLVAPDRVKTFDHRRPVTPWAHLLEDDRQGVGETDLTHLPEILALHDLALDPGVDDPEEFRARSQANAVHRCLHHHVFDPGLLEAALRETGWAILACERVRPIHLFALAEKADP